MDELDEFMKRLEDAGIISGWSDFMKGNTKTDGEEDGTSIQNR